MDSERYPRLSRIALPEDLRRFPESELPAIAEIRLEANNRTWDTIAERGDELGVYTDARPPYGCLGLTLTRTEMQNRR